MLSAVKKIWNRPEMRGLIKHSLITAFATVVGLVARYIIMAHLGTYNVPLFGRTFPVTLTDNTAYIAYYVIGLVILFVMKWATAEITPKASSFLPRFLAFTALYVVSMLTGNWMLTIFTEKFGIGAELSFWMTCVVTFIINYLGSRLIVFCDIENETAEKIREENEKEDACSGGEESVHTDDRAE